MWCFLGLQCYRAHSQLVQGVLGRRSVISARVQLPKADALDALQVVQCKLFAGLQAVHPLGLVALPQLISQDLHVKHQQCGECKWHESFARRKAQCMHETVMSACTEAAELPPAAGIKALLYMLRRILEAAKHRRGE